MADEPILQPDPQPIPEATPAPVPEPAPVSVMRSVAKRHGITDDDLAQFETDEDLADRLFSMADDYAKAAPLIQVGQQVAPHYDQWNTFQEWQAEQAKAAAQPVEPEAAAFDWPTQEFDPAWETADPSADPMGYAQAQAKLKAHKRWEQDTQRRLLREFPDLTKKALEPVLTQYRKEFEERLANLEGTLQQRDQAVEQSYVQQQENAWLAENAKEFYAHDEKGQPVVQNGQYVPNEHLRQVWQQYTWARSLQGPDGRPIPVKEAAAIAMGRVPKKTSPPSVKAEPAPRFIDTVSAAELRPVERQAGADGTASASMYRNTDAIVDAAFRSAAVESGVNLNE